MGTNLRELFSIIFFQKYFELTFIVTLDWLGFDFYNLERETSDLCPFKRIIALHAGFFIFDIEWKLDDN